MTLPIFEADPAYVEEITKAQELVREMRDRADALIEEAQKLRVACNTMMNAINYKWALYTTELDQAEQAKRAEALRSTGPYATKQKKKVRVKKKEPPS